VLVAALVPTAAFAQGANGSITGTVKDDSGAILPGVTVEVASPALTEKVRTAVSDGSGQYRVVGLPPGTYSVTFTLTGFNTFKREGIEIAGDFTATVNGDLKVGSLEETIVVTGEAPTVDVQSVQRQHVLTNEVVEAVPTGKYFVNLGVLIPGVSASCSAACQTGASQDTGGASGDNSSTLIAHGSRFRDQRISINNMTVRGSTGYLGVTGPNIEAQQETQIDTSGADTSVGTGGVRINVVPKDGGNNFAGGLYLSGTNEHFQGDNVDQALKDRGLVATTKVKETHDIAPTFGGPIKKDKVWFFLSARHNNAQNYAANAFQNANKNDPTSWTYVPDLNQPGQTSNPLPMFGTRVTWQADAKNKIAFSYDYRDRCQCTNFASGGRSPDATQDFRFRPQHIAMLTWSAPVTNKLLLQATAVDLIEGWGNRASSDAADMSLTQVSVQNGPASFNGINTFRGPGGGNWTWYPYRNTGFTATYVTGAHALKGGVEYDWGWNDRWTTAQLGSVVTNIYGQTIPVTSYRINYASTLVPTAAGVNSCGGGQICQPNQFTASLDPVRRIDRAKADGALYVQDKWTIKRVTVSGGLRYDFFRRDTDDVTEGAPPLQPNRSLAFPSQNVVSYKDLSPRLGMAWDIFGTGRTAFKTSLNRYVQDLSLLANNQYSNQQNYQSTASRAWTDNNHNFIPDCDPLVVGAQNNTSTGGDSCGALTGTNANFGLAQPTSVPDSEVIKGFQNRPFNWEYSASVQHDVIPRRLAVDFAYFRRWYGNFTTTDNPATTAADYDPFTVTVPTIDPVTGQANDLPTAGNAITFVDPNPAVASLVVTNRDRLSKNYGKQYEHWNGFDFSANARPGGSTLLQGGFSLGRATTDNCDVIAQVPEAQVQGVSIVGATANIAGPLGTPYCHQQQDWLLQVKGLGSYTIPNIEVQLSATYQNIPGPQVTATLVVPNASIQNSLGRPLSGGAANVTVNLIPPGSMFGDRLQQVDIRVGKVLRFGGSRRATASVDLFNAFNSNAVLTESSVYPTTATSSPWRQPGLVQQARLVKFTVSMQF